MFKTRKCPGTKHAFSLIESAIVLGIIGIVIGGIWVAAASMFNNYKDRDLMEGATFIYSEIQKLIPSSVYTGSPIYLQTEDGGGHKAVTMGIIPAHWVNGNKAVSGYGPVEITIDLLRKSGQ